MARTKKTAKKRGRPPKNRKVEAKISRPQKRSKKTTPVVTTPVWLQRVRQSLDTQQSLSSFILGALIIVVLAILVFNYFNKPSALTSPQTDSQMTEQTQTGDVNKNSLPGKYTVKSGDTLFSIAESYYGNGYLFTKISDENKLSNPDNLEPGQILQIPKLSTAELNPSPSPTATDNTAGLTALDTQANTQPVEGGQGGSTMETIWGERIDGTTYTVQAGDWLSKIAGRAYGDVMAYPKIAQANHIQNPDEIEPGTVLTIPR